MSEKKSKGKSKADTANRVGVQRVVKPRVPGCYKFICEKSFYLGGPGTEFVGMVFHPEKFRWCFYGVRGSIVKGHVSGFSWALKDFYGYGYFIKV